jgi:hypothetical protein
MERVGTWEGRVMNKKVEQKYNEFKQDPFGSFKETIDALENSGDEAIKAHIPMLIVTKRMVIIGYAHALFDNNLITKQEYEAIKEDLNSHYNIMKELHGEP